jgi:hypothetical protein
VSDVQERLRECATELAEVRAEMPIASYRAEAAARILTRISEELKECADDIRREARAGP